jgi:transmembrane sensor
VSRKSTVGKVSPQVREQATEWLVAFCEQEVNASGREVFDRWLRASPEHVRGYLQIAAVWESTGLLVESTKVDVEALVERALSEHNVLAHPAREIPSGISSGPSSQGSTVPSVWRAVAASLLLVCAVAGGVVWWQLTRTPMYQTGAAEQRTVRLPGCVRGRCTVVRCARPGEL